MGMLPQGAIIVPVMLTMVHGFNIQAQKPTVIPGDEDAYFGYSVLQFGSERDRGIVVSAPLARRGNVMGAIYRCHGSSGNCSAARIPESAQSQVEGVGLSLTANPTSPTELLMCAPSMSYRCGSNTFVNGICYEFDSSLNPTRNVTPAFQACPLSELDVAFLIDGSGSINRDDFIKMKQFIVSVINLFSGKNAQFSVSQFSNKAKTEFDFKGYRQSSDWTKLVNDIVHMGSVTFTPTGIKHVTDMVFTDVSGARDNANRVMIVITDGESNDVAVTFEEAIDAAKRKNILRYAIGVGDAFTSPKATEELVTIASTPSKDFVFKATDFQALKGLEDKLKEKIFAIEGTGKGSGQSSFKLELAQSGFSSIFTSDSITLGAVGAFDWAGAIIDVRAGEENVINASSTNDLPNAYLGYAMVEARRGRQRFCFAGAPRYNHVGRVVIFQRDLKGKEWSRKQNIEGEQIGSYFGMALCSVDLHGNGETELVLIGAPLYHAADTGGTVSVCTISPQGTISCSAVLRGQRGNGLGRFGSAIAALGDLNGDGIADVGVGAPLEDGHQGSVYIYQGMSGSIAPRYSQRIPASQTGSRLKYFGGSLDGRFDLTNDGLIDLVVGARGGAIILRSAPVLNVLTTVTFNPAEIPLASFDCTSSEGSGNVSVNLQICFQLDSPMAKEFGSMEAALNYTLLLDRGQLTNRAEFPTQQRSSVSLANLTLGHNCFAHRVDILNCVDDYFNPIEVSLSYCAEGFPISNLNNLKPTLTHNCLKDIISKLQFENDCGSDGVCITDLELDFNSSRLIVHSAAQLNLTVALRNLGEHSNLTHVEFNHPFGMSFRKVTIVKSHRKIPIACDDSVTRGASAMTNCRISHPIFRELSEVIFILTLDVSNSNNWSHSVQLNVTASSKNEDPAKLKNNRATLQIPIIYRVNVLVRRWDSTKILNISLSSQEMKEVVHRFQVENLGVRPMPVNVTFTTTKQLGHEILWNVSGVTPEKAPTDRIRCVVLGEVEGRAATKVNRTREGCNADSRLAMRCLVDQLVHNTPLTFALRGYVFLTNVSKIKTCRLLTVAQVSFDERRYTQAGDENDKDGFLTSEVTTDVEIIQEVNYIPFISGGAIGGLLLLVLIGVILWKVGFFKRTYKDRIDEDQTAVQAEPQCTTPLNCDPGSE